MNAAFQDNSSDAAEPTVYPATVEGKPRSPWRLTLVALALTLILGAVGGGWLALYYGERTVAQAGGTAPDSAPTNDGKTQVARTARTTLPAGDAATAGCRAAQHR